MHRRIALAACLALAVLAVPSTAAANNAPTCSDLEYATAQDAPVTLFGGCSDPDGPAPLSYTLVDHPDFGSLPQVSSNGTATYQPNLGFTGTDSLRFSATDGAGATSNVATATITVVPGDGSANEAPVCPDMSAFVEKNTPLPLYGRCIDPDGDALTYDMPSDPPHGSLAFPTGDSAIYTPDLDHLGPDSFTYRARDTHNVFATPGTVSIQVVEPGAGTFATAAAPSTSVPAVAAVSTTNESRRTAATSFARRKKAVRCSLLDGRGSTQSSRRPWSSAPKWNSGLV